MALIDTVRASFAAERKFRFHEAHKMLIPHRRDMAKALLAADKLAEAIERSDTWPNIDAALAEYRQHAGA